MLDEYEKNLKNSIKEENFSIEILVNAISEKEVLNYLKPFGYSLIKKHEGFEANLGFLRENKFFSKHFNKFFEAKQANTVMKYNIYEFKNKYF